VVVLDIVRRVEEGIDCKTSLNFGRENVGIWKMLNCLGLRHRRSAKVIDGALRSGSSKRDRANILEDPNFIVSGEQGHGQFLRHGVVLQRHLDIPDGRRRRFCGLS
ncbi:hypothetical protein BT69DRAFT_1276819, partial [Atractiella rhizophila]